MVALVREASFVRGYQNRRPGRLLRSQSVVRAVDKYVPSSLWFGISHAHEHLSKPGWSREGIALEWCAAERCPDSVGVALKVWQLSQVHVEQPWCW